MLQTSVSPAANCFLSLPSNDTHAGLLLLKGTCTLTVTCSGRIRGRKDKEWGQIGVKRMPGTCIYTNASEFSMFDCYHLQKHTCGWTIDPPAANEYAVLPDVVDKISPSP